MSLPIRLPHGVNSSQGLTVTESSAGLMFNACHCQASHCSSSVYLSHKHYYCQTVMNIITVELFSMLIQYPWAQSCSRSPAGVPAALILILAWWFLLLDPSPRITSEGNNAARVAWRSVYLCSGYANPCCLSDFHRTFADRNSRLRRYCDCCGVESSLALRS